MILTLENIKNIALFDNPVKKQRIFKYTDRWKQYRLLESLQIELSNSEIINIPKGFEWDLSSSPRIFWSILPPDGDFELGALIHDYLYRNKITSRRFADYEMYMWSSVLNDKIIDNEIRFFGVRIFGWIIWNKRK